MTRRKRALLVMFLSGLTVAPALSQPSNEDIAKIEGAAPARATMKPEKPRKLLVFNRYEGFQHRAIQFASKTLEILAKKTGAFEVVQSTEMAVFAPEYLRQFDAICFNNTTALKFEDPAHRKSLLEFIAGGKGIVGIHAATDNFNTWPEAVELFGGQFDGHPWTADGTWQVKIEDVEHPLNAAFGGKDFLIRDEIYRIRQVNLRKNCRVLLGLDAKSERNRKAGGVRASDRDLPISWVRTYGKGRLFYCSLGHNDEIYWNPAILRHYLDGIQFALGDYRVETTPVPFDPMGFFDQDSLSRILKEISTYRFGGSRAAMAELNGFIRGIEDIPEARQKLERQFLDLIRGSATPDGKQFIFTRLAQIGSDESVPVLARLLDDPASAEMALYTLEAIEGSRADEALLESMNTAKGKTLLGVVNALGRRRVEAALPVLGKLLDEKDSLMVVTAAAALAQIGTGAAMDLLKGGTSSGAVRAKVQECVLLCADHLKSAGDTEGALSAYRDLSTQGERLSIRRRALRSLILGEPATAAATITRTLTAPDARLQPTVIGIVGELHDLETVRTVARSFPTLPPAGQAQLLSALASKRDPVVQETVLSALRSRTGEVRLAAIRALATCGDVAAVRPLVTAAASAKGEEQKEARRSLYQLQSSGVDDSVMALLARSNGSLRLELIRCAGERKIPAAVPQLLEWMTDPDAEIRLESAKSLKALAPAQALPALVGQLTSVRDEEVRRELEQAAIAAARNVPDSAPRDEALCLAYPEANTKSSKVSLLKVMGKVGAPNSLVILRNALNEKDPEVRLAAIRSLAEWPSAEPYGDLWRVVTGTEDRTEKTVALRGVVRLLGMESNREPGLTLDFYTKAMGAAPSAAERRLLLSSIGQANSTSALRFAATCLSAKTLHDDAEAAVLQIAAGLPTMPSKEVVPSLEELIRYAGNDVALAKAKEQIHLLERFDDHITNWQYSGPYAMEGAKLLDEPFAPEEPSAGCEWEQFPRKSNPEEPWLLDFEKVFGGLDKVVYVRTNVYSPVECRARLELGSDDGVKAWLNGKLVHAISVSRNVRPGSDVVPVTLKRGWNTLLMKINQTDGGWGACARFRTVEGRSLEGIRAAADPAKESE